MPMLYRHNDLSARPMHKDYSSSEDAELLGEIVF